MPHLVIFTLVGLDQHDITVWLLTQLSFCQEFARECPKHVSVSGAFKVNARLLWGSRLGHRLFPMGGNRPHYPRWDDGPQLGTMDNFLPGSSIDLCAIRC